MSIGEPSRHDLTIRDAGHCIWSWGKSGARPLVLVHGWGDSGATFGFLARELIDDFWLIAPDLRGFGATSWEPRGYWFPDYLADLDALLDHFLGAQPCALLGHSMGGNIAGLYAGARPERVAQLILCEGFGLPPTVPEQAPGRYQRWLDELRSPPVLRDFASRDALLLHLAKLAPRASSATLDAVADVWARRLPDNTWRLCMDPLHKRVNPVLYRREEAIACWQAVQASVLLIAARESDFTRRYPRFDALSETARHFRTAHHHWIEHAGHMLHWEQPAALAARVRTFVLHGQ
jgi:pimeloyl-ACP methyl ester carboxylesterase